MYLTVAILALLASSVHARMPNILILLADDMGYSDLGCYGNTSVRTPNIDSIARDGVKMTQHLTAASVCTPSRSALLTGRYPVRTGMAPKGIMRVNLWPYSTSGLPESEVTIAEITRQAGYRNALIGKWHLGLHRDRLGDHAHHPLNQGFDHFYGLIGTNLVDYGHEFKVVTHARPYWYGELFSIWAVTVTALVCLLKFRYVGPVTFLLAFMFWTLPVYAIYFLFDNMELFTSFLFRNHLLVEQPIRLAGLSQRLVNEGLEFMRNATDNDLPFLLVMSWVHMHVAIKTSIEFHGKSCLGRYGDGLQELDWSVGEMLRGLRDAGVEENTLVYFTSDNGGNLEIGADGGYNGRLKGGKGHGAPDGGIRVPGLMKWPGVLRTGAVTDEPTSQMDIIPIIADAVGVPLPVDRKYDGRGILPLLKEKVAISPHEFLFHYCGDKLHAVRYRPRTGHTTWKYVTHTPSLLPGRTTCRFMCSCNNAVPLATPDVYDMTSDPGETTPIEPESKMYREISAAVESAIREHVTSLDPVESQFRWDRLVPRVTWQPCCNGIFPFNCDCVDKKFENAKS
ncbi:arylsulfatase D-like isoform X1 [Dreissena polymorpha]|uniref:Sulfatase N-terminal domain-containing protein n=1 Tax=Dreissena polymorpha TaxID=45954 RepID=A0A9D4QX63_DREPO|nr:arylsulfatase D-like isoform X1 [Dreissena polymorpha]XP_052273293.1 arylsulfatase D-like isoform X1 [Dreissena polymorpha]KAH3846961.1 hypothetical protein DPMN_089270 [Dreissena polymorpha]